MRRVAGVVLIGICLTVVACVAHKAQRRQRFLKRLWTKERDITEAGARRAS